MDLDEVVTDLKEKLESNPEVYKEMAVAGLAMKDGRVCDHRRD